MQNVIELSNLNSTTASNYNFNKYLLPAVSLDKLYDGSLTLEDTYWPHIFFREIRNGKRNRIPDRKNIFEK